MEPDTIMYSRKLREASWLAGLDVKSSSRGATFEVRNTCNRLLQLRKLGLWILLARVHLGVDFLFD